MGGERLASRRAFFVLFSVLLWFVFDLKKKKKVIACADRGSLHLSLGS